MTERRAPDAHRPPPNGPEPAMGPEERREIEAVVTLLHRLADPQPPAGLTERILEAVAADPPRETRRGPLRRAAPYFGTALAAGLGCLLVLGGLEGVSLPGGGSKLVPTFMTPVDSATTAGAREDSPRRPGAQAATPVVVVGNPPALFGASTPGVDAGRLLDRRLDHQINLLLLDPPRFFDALKRRRDRDRLIDQIGERAARRGDAATVALQLRQLAPTHPSSGRLVESLLRNALIEGARVR